MKKIVLLCSHLYSGSSALFDSMNNHPRIQGYNLSIYSSPLNLLNLAGQQHKLDNRSAIYMDRILYNYQLSTKVVYKDCKFIYLIREPEAVLAHMVVNQKIKLPFAVRYYVYRLRRLCEMAKRTPGAVLLTWEDLTLNRGMDLIEEYLNLKQPIFYDSSLLDRYKQVPNSLEFKTLTDANDSFQRYLYYLKNHLRHWS